MDSQRREVEDLFVRYGAGVGSYVLARVGDAELAEEITARVFLSVVRFKPQQRGCAAAWLWAIVRTELARHYRERKRELPELEPGSAPQPDEELLRRETQAQMRAALEQLSEDEQRVVYLKFFQGLRNHEIAEATGLGASNVGVIVFRALKRLRALMEPSPALAERSGRGER